VIAVKAGQICSQLHLTFELSCVLLLLFGLLLRSTFWANGKCLHESTVSSHDGTVDAEVAQSDGHSSPPTTLAQVFAAIRESRVEQTELLRLLVTNSIREGTTIGNGRDQA
jgi:hypothetical protein